MGKTSFQDITGKKYGRLTVIEIYDKNHGKIKWKCKCDCGAIVIVTGNNLKNGHTQSCGCYKKEKNIEIHTTHGGRRSRLYRIWTGMKTRCYDKNCRCFPNYGGKGIKVCNEWMGENGFETFRRWALDNGYSDGLSIDRINVEGDYSPDNCRWANTYTQANNTTASRYITINGKTQTVAEWEKETGIKSGTIRYRIDKMHLSPEEAISRPVTACNEKLIDFNGRKVTLTKLQNELNIDRRTLKYRLTHGIPLDKELRNDTRGFSEKD